MSDSGNTTLLTTLPTDHDAAFRVLALAEGTTLDMSPNDAGNWTGGKVGVGTLGGTRFGISSATYPQVNKAMLTAAAAEAIYYRDFWEACRCQDLPPALRFLIYSCAVNSGQGAAGTWLQLALQAQHLDFGTLDGVIGDKTVAAANKADLNALVPEITVQRLVAVSQDDIFAQDRVGLSRRIVVDAHFASLAPASMAAIAQDDAQAASGPDIAPAPAPAPAVPVPAAPPAIAPAPPTAEAMFHRHDAIPTAADMPLGMAPPAPANTPAPSFPPEPAPFVPPVLVVPAAPAPAAVQMPHSRYVPTE